MLKIAVDFDGTIVEDKYPGIGKPNLFAIETLLQLQKERHQLILWTVREGESLKKAIDFCESYGIEFYAVNKNFPEEVLEPEQSRKLNVDIFIDDRNIGGFVGWSKVWELLGNNPVEYKLPKRSFWEKIKDLFR
ncbi:hydrolase [Marivirga sp. S37H4]|uniref:Hydrolase n=1 Tax=Marivirga aurantiaca TaxID=2802615 RepID=A0A934X109_9BACT|nr:hydrolase [Marivirga aurantiaca]MBK6266430.1 hydrolase [Marivirga aurantiaca]